MRNLYPKNKGKVYPSPSSSTTPNFSSSTSASTRDVLSMLNLLPAAILALASVLSLEDREVLAYMISRSLKTTTTPLSMIEENNKCKKSSNFHKPPIFECGCFDCYRSYWFRWDSSPNRELIQHVIEAFEDYLNNGGSGTSKKNNGRGKKKERMNRRRVVEKLDSGNPEKETFSGSEVEPKQDEADPSPESDAFTVISPARAEEDEKDEEEQVQEEENGCVEGEVKWASKKNKAEEMEEELIQVPASGSDHHHHQQQSPQQHHRGLARKLIPDVFGLLNSRLWNLWSPSI